MRQRIGGVAILTIIIIVGFLVMVSYPGVEIDFYTNYNPYDSSQNIWQNTNFTATFYGQNPTFGSSYKTCFRFTNDAEPLLQYIIPASNFRIFINTNASCSDCNIYTNAGPLEAQKSADACRNITVSENYAVITINATAYWQALAIQQTMQSNYVCQKVEGQFNQFKYFCQLVS